MTFSTRAQVVTRRTYNRPLDLAGTQFETWEQTIDRVIDHQRWLWVRAKNGVALTARENQELADLRDLYLKRIACPSGRTLWLGGTDVARRREASQFNCSFGRIETVHDVVDAFWLLLQGCGVGFEPVVGTLNGFSRPIEVTIKRSTRANRGFEHNVEYTQGDVHIIEVGDSAEAWAKSVGKLLAYKGNASRLILDFTQIRPAGERLSGYGWISSGDDTISKAFKEIAALLNKRAGELLDRIDILDVLNWLGTCLSSRRSAEIAVMPYGAPQWEEFASAKKDHWIDNPQRAQSNNSLLFYKRPDPAELDAIMQRMIDAGGSEPAFINAEAALKRAPWFKGVNPCAEILLGSKSFCNLVEFDLNKTNGQDFNVVRYWIKLLARANYRQTCVNFEDGVLQRAWHELNEFLRLTGVGLTGIVTWEHLDKPRRFQMLREAAQLGAHEMADELGLPRSKAVTTVKPSGTLSKIMDTTEGVHKPLGKYIFNNIRFSKHDPLVEVLRNANYRIFDDPYSDDSVLATFPVSYENVVFNTVDGKEVNIESAVEQLDRYKMMVENYVDHNCSVTVSYDPSEKDAIVEWLLENWDSYVGVSFIFRNDPTKTAEDLGYPYLPQEVVDEETFKSYEAQLLPIDLEAANSLEELDEACSTGACPIR
ncbi:ribonucleotide reductase [Roseobacter phage CRP-125]|uniref:Ribonucleotide reductase n=1 Tax=Roseobacter phage CRP-125 TaxID=3072844 RepID=A0AAX3ZYP2_9CAUD|nr:ribonucleotide reductase [Roseobacter phage CRP-125]